MKKVLIVTYYWPPAGGPGVQRWLKFVKYLPEFGIEPIVFVPENPTYPIIDKSLTKEVFANIQVIKKSIFEPYRLAHMMAKEKTDQISSGIIDAPHKQSLLQKIMLFVRGNFFIPDARKFWVKPATRFLVDYLEKEHIETLITTGPPHSMHLIGWKLKQQLSVKWIADFRDPWTTIGYHHKLRFTESTKSKHKALEKKVLNAADQIITTSFKTRKQFMALTDKPITVITNGYDEPMNQTERLDAYFTISHIGSLLSGRNPLNLWKTIRELREESEAFRQKFKLRLIGKVSHEVMQSIEKQGLLNAVEEIDYVEHDQAIKFQQRTHILLLIEVNSAEKQGIIPGKLFEYLNARRPILAVGPKHWDVQKIIRETHSGKCFNYNEKAKLKNSIYTYFEDFQKGELEVQPKNIDQFHRRNLTKKLTELL